MRSFYTPIIRKSPESENTPVRQRKNQFWALHCQFTQSCETHTILAVGRRKLNQMLSSEVSQGQGKKNYDNIDVTNDATRAFQYWKYNLLFKQKSQSLWNYKIPVKLSQKKKGNNLMVLFK